MIPREELKRIVMLGYLTGEMLDKLVPITDLLLLDEGDYVFRQGDKADRFYMVRRGKVVLEQRISDTVTVMAASIKPGFSFGWSSMLEEQNYTTDAVCTERTELFSFLAGKFKEVMDRDHSMGYVVHQGLLRILKKRYDARTDQFIRVLTNHPDLKRLL
jgi:CRP-like cAMP-binding protein